MVPCGSIHHMPNVRPIFVLAVAGALAGCSTATTTVTTSATAPTTTEAATTAPPVAPAAATTIAATTIAATTTTAPFVVPRPKPAASTVAGLLAMTRPIVLAHAGGEDAHPHSTPYGYADSVAANVDLIDLDVQLSKDGVLVVQHDDTIDRTTNGTGKVADMTYAELFKLDNAYWFTKTCTCADQPESAYVWRGVRTGAKPAPKGYVADDFAIARFEDIAKRFPDHVLNIEIKGQMPDALPAARELARLIVELRREDSTVVTSFDDSLAEAFHTLVPTVNVTPGLSATTDYVLSNKLPPTGRTILQVPPEFNGIKVLTPDLVARTKADGLVLWIWPNERKWENLDGYTELLKMGVAGINAADPASAIHAVKQLS
jgi:glycerophosphoryl diester phosphodiesterase